MVQEHFLSGGGMPPVDLEGPPNDEAFYHASLGVQSKSLQPTS